MSDCVEVPAGADEGDPLVCAKSGVVTAAAKPAKTMRRSMDCLLLWFVKFKRATDLWVLININAAAWISIAS